MPFTLSDAQLSSLLDYLLQPGTTLPSDIRALTERMKSGIPTVSSSPCLQSNGEDLRGHEADCIEDEETTPRQVSF